MQRGMSQSYFAKAVGSSPATIGKLCKEGVLNMKKTERWNMIRLIDHFRKKATRGGVDVDYGRNADLNTERIRIAHHKANAAALKEMEVKGTLLPVSVVVEHCSSLAAELRQNFMAIPMMTKNRFPEMNEEMYQYISSQIKKTLRKVGKSGLPKKVKEIIKEY